MLICCLLWYLCHLRIYSTSGVCNLFHWGATFENFNNVEGQSPPNMYKIIKCKAQPVYYVINYYIASHTVNVGFEARKLQHNVLDLLCGRFGYEKKRIFA